jgi:hypothetical protein
MSLSAFDSENAFGTWQLNVQNVSELRNRGTINSWALEVIPGESTGDGGPGRDDNDAPIPADDNLAVNVGQALVIDVADLLSNDSDPNDDPLSIVSVGNPLGGSVEFNGDTITFTPDDGSLAPGMFEYVVSDGIDSAIGHVTVRIVPSFNLHNGFDVNADGYISAIDPLSVINYINAYGSTPIIGLGSSAKAKLYYDVVPDNVIAPNDALAVINYINQHPGNRPADVSSISETSAGAANGPALSAAAVDLLLASNFSTADAPRLRRR